MNKKLTLLTFSLLIAFMSCKSVKNNEATNKAAINSILNDWHKAAAQAKFDDYFSMMTDRGVFIGTDATENWQKEAFKTYSKPYFDKGKAWNFTPLERNIYLNKEQNTAWFDELLDTQMKICRGSGVLIKEKGEWKIAHYVLSMTVPNDKISETIKIKAAIEDSIINKLKANRAK